MSVSRSELESLPRYWPSARHFTEAIQCPGISFLNPALRETLPAVDRLGMPLVTSGQFAYVYKLKSRTGLTDYAVRCFRGYLGDRDQRYTAIQRHIRQFSLSSLCGFTYEPAGILVSGNRFPILFMDWIEGPTLDLYIENMIGRRDVLLHLADEWLKVVSSLRESSIAHGDLQHGNIIVEHGKLRLVDHDGIFVPEMAGWSSSEVGHQHYQHPRRDAQLFDASLDNFSALVIYLSLVALAEEPQLWPEHHDENLIFTKSDFVSPSTSNLFARIRELGPEHCRLADVLEQAALGEPGAVPRLLDLVSVKSTLPSWMTAPPDLESKPKTREVNHLDAVTLREDSRWIPWQAKRASSSVPATPPSSTVQTIFGGTVTPGPTSAMARIRNPGAIFRNTPIFAKELLGRTFLFWYWGIYLFLKIFGLDFFYSISLAVFCLAAICLTYGFIRAQQVARAALAAKASQPVPPLTSQSQAQVAAINSWRPATIAHVPTNSMTATEPIVANLALNIYHLHDCDWVNQISKRNRINFSSPTEASSAGYKPCQVCSRVP